MKTEEYTALLNLLMQFQDETHLEFANFSGEDLLLIIERFESANAAAPKPPTPTQPQFAPPETLEGGLYNPWN